MANNSIFIGELSGSSTGGGTVVLSGSTLQWPLGTDLVEDGANVLSQRNSTNAQRFNVANTFTSSISREDFSVDWQTTANLALVGTRTAATGTGRALGLISQTSNAGSVSGILITRAAAPLFRMGITDTSMATWAGATGTTGNYTQLADFTNTATTGPNAAVALVPTYNQASGNAANTDLLINRTETLVGSGAQRFLDCQVAGVTKFSVDNAGVVRTAAATGFTGTVTPVTSITVVGGIVTAVS